MNAVEGSTSPQKSSKTAIFVRLVGMLIKHPTIFISLMTATLFYGGYVYNAAYLSGLGIEETQFSVSIDRMLFQGFISGIDTLIKFVVPFFIGSVFYFILCIALSITAERFKERLSRIGKAFERFCDRFSKKKINTTSQPLLVGSSAVFTSFVILFSSILTLYFLFFVMMTYRFSNQAGQEAAKTFMKNCSSGKYKKTGIFLKNIEVAKGCSIICNTGECAYLFANGMTKVIDRQGGIISQREAGKFK